MAICKYSREVEPETARIKLKERSAERVLKPESPYLKATSAITTGPHCLHCYVHLTVTFLICLIKLIVNVFQIFLSQALSSGTSIAQQQKASSGTDTGTDVTSGSDTEAAPSVLEQNLSPPIQSKPESSTMVLSIEKVTGLPVDDIPSDSPANSIPKAKPSDQTPACAEHAPKESEVSSVKNRVPEEMAVDTTSVLTRIGNASVIEREISHELSESGGPRETDIEMSLPNGTDSGVNSNIQQTTASVHPEGGVSNQESGPPTIP